MLSIDDDLRIIRNRMTSNILTILAIFAPIATLASITRAEFIGWQPVMALHVAITSVICITFLFRQKLGLTIKAIVISASFILTGVGGILQFGTSTPAYSFLNMGTCIVAIVYGLRAGIYVYLFCLFTMLTVAFGGITFGITLTNNISAHINSPQSWATVIIGTMMCVGLLLYVIDSYHRSLISSLRTTRVNEARLLERTHQLEVAILDREQLLSKLRASEEFKSIVVNSLPSEIAVLDKHGIIVDVNETWRQFALDNSCDRNKTSPNTGIGSSYFGICQAAEGSEKKEAFEAHNGIQAVLNGLSPIFTMEYPCHSPTEQRWFSMVVSPLGHDLIRGVVITHTNITKIKQAEADREQALLSVRISEERLRTIFDASPDAMLISDADGIITMSNNQVESLLGYKHGDIIGKSIDILVPEAYRQSHLKLRLSYLSKSDNKKMAIGRTIYAHRKDGSECEVEITLSVISVDSRQYIASALRDISERRRAEGVINKLEVARQAAEGANRAKSEFLSHMSHELRTPLNAVLGFTDILLWGRDSTLNEKQRSQLAHIREAGEHLLSLINEVLDLAKIEAGHVALDIATVQLRSIVEECLSLSSPIFSQYEVSAINETETTGCECNILTDPTRAKQLILNLLSNAAKYNRRGGSIHVSHEMLDDGFYRVSVADTGSGIPEDMQGGLFMPFNRLGAESSEIEGTGIGLALTKKLIEAMDGRIGYASVFGEGSRFWLDFPPSKKGGQETVAVAVDITQDAISAPNFPEAIVLYIEDNSSNRMLMEAMFEQLTPLRLIAAASAETGLSAAENQQPDIILLDINLPGMDGFAANDRLKENPKTRHIPVVALSADAIKETADRALASGFADFLTKPIRRSDLIHTLHNVMEHRHAKHN